MTFHLIKDFVTTFGQKIRDTPNVRVPEAKLRFELIREELEELRTAYTQCDIVEMADAFGDIEFVVIGAAFVFGISERVEEIYHLTVEFIETGALVVTDEAIFSEREQMEILDELRDNILRNDADETAVTLGTLLAFNRFTAEAFGIDLDYIVAHIHASNMTKLGEDGKPIYRETDRKVIKGPNYVTPTADIEVELFGSSDLYAKTV